MEKRDSTILKDAAKKYLKNNPGIQNYGDIIKVNKRRFMIEISEILLVR